MNGLYNCFIINPIAGKGNGKEELAEKIKIACEKRSEQYEIYFSKYHGDTPRYVREVCERESGQRIRFYSCGGDGTLNEVINGAVGYENAEIAAVPAGTGNDFIKSFSELSNFSDIERQLDGTVIKTDLIKFGDKYCAHLLNIGFDCTVVEKMKSLRSKINVSNGIAYPLGVISAFFGSFGQRFSITLDGEETINKSFLLSAFGNGRIYGGGYHATPLAYINDGLLDVCLIEKISRAKFLSLIGKYKKGEHVVCDKPIDSVTYKKCSRVTFESSVPVGVCFDGEVEKYSSLVIEIVREVLPFAVPRGSDCICALEKDAAAAPEIQMV